jgi:outer membrane lipoprotein-sorting protein
VAGWKYSVHITARAAAVSVMATLGVGLLPVHGRAQDATEIVKKADELMRGKSSFTRFTMTIEKPGWSRTMAMKAWSLEPDYSLVYVTDPARDKGTVTLKRGNEVWNWLPTVQKVIKIPPSMMLQSWMGSDFSNDDLVRASSIVRDYTHRLLGKEIVEGRECYELELTPDPEAGVVWGKVLLWISVEGYMEFKTEYYDEDGMLVRSFLGSRITTFGDRTLPAHWEMIPHATPGSKTVIDYEELRFDERFDSEFFSLQNMKRVH